MNWNRSEDSFGRILSPKSGIWTQFDPIFMILNVSGSFSRIRNLLMGPARPMSTYSWAHEHILMGPAHEHILMGPAYEHILMGPAHELILMGPAHDHMLMGPAREHMLMGPAHEHMVMDPVHEQRARRANTPPG
jgi:hypothetical protein